MVDVIAAFAELVRMPKGSNWSRTGLHAFCAFALTTKPDHVAAAQEWSQRWRCHTSVAAGIPVVEGHPAIDRQRTRLSTRPASRPLRVDLVITCIPNAAQLAHASIALARSATPHRLV